MSEAVANQAATTPVTCKRNARVWCQSRLARLPLGPVTCSHPSAASGRVASSPAPAMLTTAPRPVCTNHSSPLKR
eukprot:2378173-Alexandrium_andersonii.AAC.1